jgi:hypothetical protein
VVGDDEVSAALLSQTDLTEHSVEVLGRILLLAGRTHDPDPGADFAVPLHSEGQRDLSVVVEDGEATLTWDASPSDRPGIVSDPAARHLFIWGRQPLAEERLISHLDQAQLTRLQVLLSGY